MNAVPFDTLKLVDRLQAGGFTPEQARATAAALVEVANAAEFATRQDVALVGDELRRVKDELKQVRDELKQDLTALEQRIDQKLLLLEQRITIRLGGMMVIAVGVLLAAIRYLPPYP